MDIIRLKWKLLFFAMLIFMIFTLYDSLNTPEILAPTHPLFISIFLFIIDTLILIGAYNYAFKKKLLPSIRLWKLIIFLLYLVNFVILLYEYINRSSGYEISDIFYQTFFTLIIVFIISLPAHNYYKTDLIQAV